MSYAFSLYHEDFQQLPGYKNLQAITQDEREIPSSWVFPLIPYIDVKFNPADNNFSESPYLNIYTDFGPGAEDATRGEIPEAIIFPLLCPEAMPEEEQAWVNESSFVVNCGMADLPLELMTKEDQGKLLFPPDWESNGVFQNQWLARTQNKITQANFEQISDLDGLENTMLVSENLDSGKWIDFDEPLVGFIWASDKTPEQYVPLHVNELLGQGDGSYRFARMSSYHPGGVNLLMASGANQFLNQDIDKKILSQMMTTDSKNAKYPGTDQIIWEK